MCKTIKNQERANTLQHCTSCDWLVLSVHVKESGVDLEEVVKFGHNNKKKHSEGL